MSTNNQSQELAAPRSLWQNATCPPLGGFWARAGVAGFLPTAAVSLMHFNPFALSHIFPRVLVASATGTAWNYHFWIEQDIQRGVKLESAASFWRTVSMGLSMPFAIVATGTVTSSMHHFIPAMLRATREQSRAAALCHLRCAGSKVSRYATSMTIFAALSSPFMGFAAAALYLPAYSIIRLTLPADGGAGGKADCSDVAVEHECTW